MFDLFIIEYEKQIYSKHKGVNFKNLLPGQWFTFCVTMLFLGAVLVSVILKNYKLATTFLLLGFLGERYFLYQMNKYKRDKNIQNIEAYKTNILNKTVNILKDNNFKLFSKHGISGLKKHCDEILLSGKAEKNAVNSIKEFAKIFIVPIIATLLTCFMSANDIAKSIAYAILFVAAIVYAYVIISTIIPIIYINANKKYYIAESLKQCLEYISIQNEFE